MIANIHQTAKAPVWHHAFADMVQTIRNRAEFAFRHLDPAAQDEAVQDALANAFLEFLRLVRARRAHLAFPSAIARFAIAQTRCGRQLGRRANLHDILSRDAQRANGFQVESLYQTVGARSLPECLMSDRRASPADLAIIRIDFKEWLRRLTPRERKIARWLAEGKEAADVALRLGVSPGRITQIRRQLERSWGKFQGE